MYMNLLDSREQIVKLDKMSMLSSIEKLSDQVLEVEKEVENLKIPSFYKKVKNIVFLGMGGSALGAHCIKSIFEKDLSIPVEVSNSYVPPAYVNSSTLVICISYSGNTEETTNALNIAKKKGGKIIAITSGGEIKKYTTKNKLPCLVFNAVNNPCGSPRMGLGYTLFSPLLILGKLGMIKNTKLLTKKAFESMKRNDEQFGAGRNFEFNPAKKLAHQIQQYSVWFVSASYLSGNAHIAANQLNENSKRFGGYFLIPELNHHLLEGMSFPENNPTQVSFLFFESKNFEPKIQKRFSITKEILYKNNIPYFEYVCKEKTVIEQSMEILVLSSYLSFYAALLKSIDPTAIPFVEYFKTAIKD